MSVAALVLIWACSDTAATDTEEESAPPPELAAVRTSTSTTSTSSTAGGCPSSGYTRLVAVSTASQLSSAISAALPGDQIRLAAGTYLGARTLSRSGTASAPITLCGLPGTWPVLHGGRLKLSGSYLVVTGLVFEGPDNSNVNVYITGGHDIQFTRNEVRYSDWHAGISIELTHHVSITDNFIHDNGKTEIDHGIYYRAQSGPGNLVANNLIVGGAGRGISMHDNGGAAINDATVVDNTIVRNGSTGLLLAANGGSGNVIANNILADNGYLYDYKQIRIKSGHDNLITKNIVWSPTSTLSGIESWVTTNTVTGNVTQNPLFVTPYKDLHLQAGSPAIGLADSRYSVSPDYDSKTRDSDPDDGALEH